MTWGTLYFCLSSLSMYSMLIVALAEFSSDEILPSLSNKVNYKDPLCEGGTTNKSS